MRIRKNEIKNSTATLKPKRNVTGILIAAIVMIGLFGAIAYSLGKLFETTTYYALNTNVQQGAKITTSMLEAREIAVDSKPENAIDISVVASDTVTAKYDLNRGDVLASSNVNAKGSDSFGDIPKNWVVTSFAIDADNAADGTISRGDFFDIMMATPNGMKYIALNMRCIDITSSSNTVDEAGKKNNSGASLLYTVALPQDRAAQFQASVTAQNANLKMVRSSKIDVASETRLLEREKDMFNKVEKGSLSSEQKDEMKSIKEDIEAHEAAIEKRKMELVRANLPQHSIAISKELSDFAGKETEVEDQEREEAELYESLADKNEIDKPFDFVLDYRKAETESFFSDFYNLDNADQNSDILDALKSVEKGSKRANTNNDNTSKKAKNK